MATGAHREGLTADGQSGGLAAVRLSHCDRQERERLIRSYRHRVYEPAFPDASIREDPQYWLDLLGSPDYPAPPQPLIDVVLLVDSAQEVVAGVTIEFYRTAGCGLLTYISVAADMRSRGIGRRLVAMARAALDAMASPDTPMFAETERIEDAHDEDERGETIVRQMRLARLGARMVGFDYVMPPLRPDSAPHRLHLMVFDPQERLADVAASRVAGLMRELAAALGAELGAHPGTAAMMAMLDSTQQLPVVPLPAVAGTP